MRVHRYEPHFFHTSNMAVVEWLSRFTEWLPYEHKVHALLEDGRYLPLPLNRRSFELFYRRRFADPAALAGFLAPFRGAEPNQDARRAVRLPRQQPGAILPGENRGWSA